jgi:chemotaxis methyl-accepting protein methylase
LRTRVRVNQAAARSLQAATLDIVTERLTDERFDLIVATNILPYFGDTELALAVTNISAMLAPGGVFLHNEARPVLGDLTTALGMPFVQSRHATIASVKGAPAPLFDSVWLHRRAW